ncbi:hypothetical protein D3Z48_12575 [Clostridiaceae bacterium]|nr:hypothetical protein [Clostridiaceae bacterium]
MVSNTQQLFCWNASAFSEICPIHFASPVLLSKQHNFLHFATLCLAGRRFFCYPERKGEGSPGNWMEEWA